MIQRKTQDPVYWSDYTIIPDDLQYLSTLLVEDELPRSKEALSRALVLHRSRQEKALVESALSKGTPYQPQGSYEVGEMVVFPVLDYRVGEVVDVREGHNPEYDAFRVIRVAFEDDEEREFAAELMDHPLNRAPQPTVAEDDLRSPEELADIYAPQLTKKLEERLEDDPDFIRLAGKWFRKDLLVDVNVGHLNLAEAVLDVSGGGPLPTDDLLGDVELPEEISPQLRIFSLNYALQQDERFDEVGPSGKVLWYLRSMEPEQVRETPHWLEYRPVDYEPALLTSEMRSLVRRLDDEWTNLEGDEEVSESETVVLIYPHWRAGTLPLSDRLTNIFPRGHTYRIRFTFLDGDTGDEMPGWVLQEDRYVYGLEDWYRENHIPVGAYLELSQGDDPSTVIVRPRDRRTRKEWVRVARPVDGRLNFEMHRESITCKYDDLMVVATGKPGALDEVWDHTQRENLSLEQLVDHIFPELVKLSPQGNVHAATLYSAVNVAKRTPPGPLLAVLVDSGKYAPVGDNYWVLHTASTGV